MMKKLILLLFIAFPLLHAQDPSARFEEANRLFKTGNYREAIGTYRQLVAEGYRGHELYFNLGLAYSRAGETGFSILFLEKSLLHDRNNAKAHSLLINENLKIKEKIVPVPEFFIFKFFRDIAGLASVWSWLLIVFTLFLLLLAAVTGYILKFRGLTRGRALVITGLLLLLIALTLPPFLISYDEARNLRECVVLDSSIHLYEIPELEGKKAGLITEGNKLRVTGSVAGWYRVTLPNGKEGWILMKGVGEV